MGYEEGQVSVDLTAAGDTGGRAARQREVVCSEKNRIASVCPTSQVQPFHLALLPEGPSILGQMAFLYNFLNVYMAQCLNTVLKVSNFQTI